MRPSSVNARAPTTTAVARAIRCMAATCGCHNITVILASITMATTRATISPVPTLWNEISSTAASAAETASGRVRVFSARRTVNHRKPM